MFLNQSIYTWNKALKSEKNFSTKTAKLTQAGVETVFYYETKAETSVGRGELLVLTSFLNTLFYYFTLQFFFFLTQCGQEGDQEDDNKAKRMENIRNSRKRMKQEEINHQNFITLDCLTGEQRKKNQTIRLQHVCLLSLGRV